MRVIGASTLDRSAVPATGYTIAPTMLSRMIFGLYHGPRLAIVEELMPDGRPTRQARGGDVCQGSLTTGFTCRGRWFSAAVIRRILSGEMVPIRRLPLTVWLMSLLCSKAGYKGLILREQAPFGCRGVQSPFCSGCGGVSPPDRIPGIPQIPQSLISFLLQWFC